MLFYQCLKRSELLRHIDALFVDRIALLCEFVVALLGCNVLFNTKLFDLVWFRFSTDQLQLLLTVR